MTMRRLIPTLAITVAVGAALSGCLSNPGADPPPTIATASGYTPATQPSPTTTDPATKERLDRQNAEDIWHQFNNLLFSIESLPLDQVEPAIAAVAVDPIATGLRATNTNHRAEHKAGYGTVISSISWPQPINGADTAVLMDCQDGSQAGILDTTTGNRLTVGTKNTSFRGTLVRSPAGWRVQNGELLKDETCTPAA